MFKSILNVLSDFFSSNPRDFRALEALEDLEWKKNKVRMMIHGRHL